jgi:uncharacterized protein
LDRLFLDANVLFSAAYRSNSGVRRLWALTGVDLVTSTYTAEEARRNLADKSQGLALEGLLDRVEVVGQPPILEEFRESGLPEKDLLVLAAAVEAGVTHLITGDQRHFGVFFGKELCGVMVLRPAAYLKLAR